MQVRSDCRRRQMISMMILCSVSDPDPDPDPPGSTAFSRNRIRIHFNLRSGSGSTLISFNGSGSTLQMWIPGSGSGSMSKWDGSETLIITVCYKCNFVIRYSWYKNQYFTYFCTLLLHMDKSHVKHIFPIIHINQIWAFIMQTNNLIWIVMTNDNSEKTIDIRTIKEAVYVCVYFQRLIPDS